MAYSLDLIIDGKKTNFKRTQAPFLVDETQALILQQHQIKTFGSDESPTDKALLENEKDIGNFAAKFFRNQFSADDFINGADSKAMAVYTKITQDCLGSDDSDNGEAKK